MIHKENQVFTRHGGCDAFYMPGAVDLKEDCECVGVKACDCIYIYIYIQISGTYITSYIYMYIYTHMIYTIILTMSCQH